MINNLTEDSKTQYKEGIKPIELFEQIYCSYTIHETKCIFRILKELTNYFGSKKDFLVFLLDKIKNKKFVFIRHAQAEHNEFNIYHKPNGVKKPTFFDPIITKEGIEQCKEITETIRNFDFKVELVFVSPLRRTLQTLSFIKDAFPSDTKKFLVTELAREHVTNPDTHIGCTLSEMKELYKDLDYLNFQFLTKEKWWDPKEDSKCLYFMKENQDNYINRIGLLILWMTLREENHITVVSHSKVYKTMNYYNKREDFKKAKHGGLYILDNQVLYLYLEYMLKILR